MRLRVPTCVALAAGLVLLFSGVASASLRIPVCTVVAVHTIEKVTSAKARPGDFFRFRSVGALQIAGRTVIPANTLGYGIVNVASSAGRGHGGALLMEPLYFKLAGGNLGVVLARNQQGLDAQGANGQLPGYLGAIPVPGVGALLTAVNAMKRGKDVTIDAGTLFAVYASNDPATARCDRTR